MLEQNPDRVRPLSKRDPKPRSTLGRLLTPQEVADLLRVPVRTLERWRYRGDGPDSLRVGRHVRYRPGDVDYWLTNQERPKLGGR